MAEGAGGYRKRFDFVDIHDDALGSHRDILIQCELLIAGSHFYEIGVDVSQLDDKSLLMILLQLEKIKMEPEATSENQSLST
ncbi:hypothetical protein HPP92_006910 [Vanilla planifolia]|uniref:Uncharacterized protein n=1 Tax=Vanilla planifolia TaxID=51239 RepID=A0A835RQ56_VANPL|nr:hypothetical protein HPP92_006910 [Vanilla planifolia]